MTLPVCTITATIFGNDGAPMPLGKAYLIVTRIEMVDTFVEPVKPESVKKKSDALGLIEIDLPRNSNVTLKGNINLGDVNFEQGVTVFVPDSATANLEDLVIVAGVPTTGIVVQDDGTPFVDKVGTLNFVGFTVTETTPGVAEIEAGAAALEVNTQVVESYTLQASDLGKLLVLSDSAGVAVEVPASLGIGFHCECLQLDDGKLTFTGTGGMNMRYPFSKSETSAEKHALVRLRIFTATSCSLSGDLLTP